MMRTTRARLALPVVAGLALGASAVGTTSAAEASERALAPFELIDTMQNATEKTAGDAKSTSTITLDGDSMTISIKGTGFTPNMPHAQHFHGSFVGKKQFTCPDTKADKNKDGQVDTEEGLPSYGDIVLSLTTKGGTTAKDGLDVKRMPVADKDGNLQYERTIKLPKGAGARLANLVIVQHGLDVNGNNKYDVKALGVSSFAKSQGVQGVPEEATNPITCGQVSGIATPSAEVAPEQVPPVAPPQHH